MLFLYCKAEFTKLSILMKNLGSSAVYSNLKSAEDCANACLSTNKFPCNSFDFCPDSSKCYLSSQHISTGKQPSTNTSCQHYSSGRSFNILYKFAYIFISNLYKILNILYFFLFYDEHMLSWYTCIECKSIVLKS